MKNKVTNYSLINLNVATLIQDGKVCDCIFPFNDLESLMIFVSKLLEDFKSANLRSILASKYLVVDKDCNKYTFDIIGDVLILYNGFSPIAYKRLKGVN